MNSTFPADKHDLDFLRPYTIENSPVPDPQLEVCHFGGPTESKSMPCLRLCVSFLKLHSHRFLEQRSVTTAYDA